jgi:hypothetical protein
MLINIQCLLSTHCTTQYEQNLYSVLLLEDSEALNLQTTQCYIIYLGPTQAYICCVQVLKGKSFEFLEVTGKPAYVKMTSPS